MTVIFHVHCMGRTGLKIPNRHPDICAYNSPTSHNTRRPLYEINSPPPRLCAPIGSLYYRLLVGSSSDTKPNIIISYLELGKPSLTRPDLVKTGAEQNSLDQALN